MNPVTRLSSFLTAIYFQVKSLSDSQDILKQYGVVERNETINTFYFMSTSFNPKKPITLTQWKKKTKITKGGSLLCSKHVAK